jgi:uncharacterized protein with FMN-binding domain
VRRVVIVVLATIGGLALIASFHTTPGVATRPLARGRSALQPPAGGTPPTSAGRSSSPRVTAPSSGAPASKTVVGPVVTNRYGPVQVEVVVRDGQLIDVESVQLPSDRSRSRYINSIAGPELRQEALQVRSANVDIITGATYTSQSYAQSLQGALDQAGL